ncbi:glutamate receptor ionotropic, kainate 1-like isoform X2 [Macrobrachium nipponense]|uniref:glutamate receptor ionotropic, kainate 1-like isoform X2 n=1 Tax=Macrobrachium nipponense TaxID=159736 RepID=UPI0030C81425
MCRITPGAMVRSCYAIFLFALCLRGIVALGEPYSSEDVSGMARFISEFVQHLRIYSLCISSTSGSANLAKEVLASISSYLVFTSPCCVFKRNQNRTKICSAYDRHRPSSSSFSPSSNSYPMSQHLETSPSSSAPPTAKTQKRSKKKSLPNLAEVHLTSEGEMAEATDDVLERYQLTQGAIALVIVGVDLKVYHKKGVRTARWIAASYKNHSASISEVYSFSDFREDLWLEMGQWQASRGVSLRHFPGEALRDFQGHTIRTAFFPYAPYIMTGRKCPRASADLYGSSTTAFQYDPTCASGPPRHSTAKDLYVGYLIDVVEALADRLNFTYELILPKNKSDYIFGVGEDDNFQGLVGMVVRKEADIALASLSYSRSRIRSIDFSTNVDYFERNLYIREGATHSAIGWGTYAMSFDKWTWLSIVFTLVLTSITFWILMGRESDPPEDIVRFRDILFMFFSCTVQQGTLSAPESYRGRTVLWNFWFTCVILYAAYTAVLTSYLTVSTESFPFTTLQGAINSHPEWEVGILEGTPLRQLIEDSDGPYRILSHRLASDPSLLVTSDTHGIEKALTENFAFFADTPFLQYMLRDNCSISEIPVGLFFTYGHLGLAKNLPYVNILDSSSR